MNFSYYDIFFTSGQYVVSTYDRYECCCSFKLTYCIRIIGPNSQNSELTFTNANKRTEAFYKIKENMIKGEYRSANDLEYMIK